MAMVHMLLSSHVSSVTSWVEDSLMGCIARFLPHASSHYRCPATWFFIKLFNLVLEDNGDSCTWHRWDKWWSWLSYCDHRGYLCQLGVGSLGNEIQRG